MTLGTIFTLPGITVSRKTCPSLNPYIKDVYQRLFFSHNTLERKLNSNLLEEYSLHLLRPKNYTKLKMPRY